VAGVAGTKIQNQSSTLRKNQVEKEIHLLRSARPATTASNATNTPITAQAGVVSTTYVCVTVVTELCVAATVAGVITWGKADAVLAGLSSSASNLQYVEIRVPCCHAHGALYVDFLEDDKRNHNGCSPPAFSDTS
jgi:hypothetical protein